MVRLLYAHTAISATLTCMFQAFAFICRRLPYDTAGSTIVEMNSATKLLAAMRRNPLDWQLAQLQTVARQHGVDWRHDGGSHCVFVRSDGKTLPVPAHRPIKPIYIRKFIDLIDGA